MKYEKILKVLGPCGLNCSKCIGYEDGPVREHAKELHGLLNGFDSYAEKFSSIVPAFKNYSSFKEVLEVFVGADCAGCRNNEKKYPHCSIAGCFKDKEIDFCFQCGDYPCDPAGIDPGLHERWLKINDRMKDIGAEAYYEETKDKPRYK